MKKLLIVLLSVILFISCNKDESEYVSNTLGGTTELPMNDVGNIFYTTIQIDGINYNTNGHVEVVKNDNGIITLHINATLPTYLSNIFPTRIKDDKGNLDTEIKLKNTSEGIIDYTNMDDKPFLVVKYDAKVGDKYLLKKSDGKSLNRSVTKHSTKDDFEWKGGQYYYLKTVTVEQGDFGVPGIDKVVFNANHKFGLVGFEIVMEDGTSIKIFLNSQNY